MDPRDSVSLLHGTWRIGASNIPVWLSGERRSPALAYDAVAKHPLWLVNSVAYSSVDGYTTRISAVARWRAGRFVSRDSRIHKVFPSKWWVAGSSDDNGVVAIRFAKTRAMPAGINILVRGGQSIADLRALVGKEYGRLGLIPEEFARLTWFAMTSSPRRMRR